MKAAIITFVTLLYISGTLQQDASEECMKELGFTTEIPNQNVSCYEACIEVKKKNLNPDFTINVDNQVQNLKLILKPDDAVNPEQMKVVLTKCKDVAKGKHICEVTKITSSCLFKELKNLPIAKPE